MVACCPIVGLTALGAVLLLPERPEVWAAAAVAASAAALGAGRPSRNRAAAVLACLGIGFALGAAGSQRLAVRSASAFTSLPVHRVAFYGGVALADSTKTSDGGSFHRAALTHVSTDSAEASARGRAVLFDPSGRLLSRGQLFEAVGSLERADRTCTVDFSGAVARLAVRGFASRRLRLRWSVRQGLDRLIGRFGFPASSLFRALFLGVREEMQPRAAAAFERTGTLHVLALSGLHVGIISFLIYGLLFPLSGRWVKWVVVMAVLVFYLFLAGPRPSLTRAVLFLLFTGVARLLDRDRRPLNTLSLTLITVLMIAPQDAFSLSFQLSFLAMAGILTVGRWLAYLLAPYVPRLAGLPLSCTVGAQTAVLPLALASFGVFYPSAIIATPLLIPLVTLFLWSGLLFLPLAALNAAVAERIMALSMNGLYRSIMAVVGFLARFPGLSGPWVLYGWCGLVAAILGCLLYNAVHRRTWGSSRWITEAWITA